MNTIFTFMRKHKDPLILKKGTYTIPKTLYVPSNVTIWLKDGTKIVKSNYTGTKKVGPSNTLFQFVKPSLSLKKGFEANMTVKRI